MLESRVNWRVPYLGRYELVKYWVEDTEFEEGPRTREAAAAFRAHVEQALAARPQ